MGFRSLRVALLMIAVGYAAVPACAADFGADALRRYGGTYSTRCDDAAAPTARIEATALRLQANGRSHVGSGVQDAVSYFGQAAPPNYQTALLSTLPGGRELNFIVYRDGRGRYLTVAADPKLLAALGVPARATLTLRDCDTGRARADGAAARAELAQEARDAREAERSSPVDARFRALYRQALGVKRHEPWLVEMDGPSHGPKTVQIGAVSFVRYGFCKPHDCADNRVLLLYSAERRILVGRLQEHGSQFFVFGAPSPAMAAELRRQWDAEWR